MINSAAAGGGFKQLISYIRTLLQSGISRGRGNKKEDKKVPTCKYVLSFLIKTLYGKQMHDVFFQR